jgi:PiT family inorganic phosphate transporter
MVSALLAAAIWLHLATYMGLPVSTTHSIVGAVVGFGLVGGGIGAIKWIKILYVVASWLFSPILGGAIAFFLFVFIRKRIIESTEPIIALRRYTPCFVFLVVFILTLSFIYKGLKNLHLDFPLSQALGLALLVGLVGSLLGYLLLSRGLTTPSLSTINPSPTVEEVFRWLQVMTAAYVAFAHGSNDTANAVGPMAAIGKKITDLTPSSGFSAEFGAATTILIGSKLGLPLSTTHTIVGAVIGVGLARGMVALNLRIVRNIINSWIATLPFTAGLTMLLYAILTTIAGI